MELLKEGKGRSIDKNKENQMQLWQNKIEERRNQKRIKKE